MAKHTRESATKFWIRTGTRPIVGLGGALALAGFALFAAVVVGGVWYLVVRDLLGNADAAFSSAVAGSAVVFLFVVVGGGSVLWRTGSIGHDRR